MAQTTCLVIASALLCCLALDASAAGDDMGFDGFAFTIPPDGLAEGTAPAVLARLEAPAGAEGFVEVSGDRFTMAESGRPVRFWATNLCFSGCFPPHDVAERMARRMGSLGINCVRFHHMDSAGYPNGIWSAEHNWGDFAHTDLHPEALDRLDYFIAQLKKHGVYVNLNLHVSREYGERDGFPAVGPGQSVPGYGKGVDHFYPRCIEEQKRYARMLLRHVNKYTGNAYAEEPAVAMVEINNEDGLLQEWRGGSLDNLPRPYVEELERRWNEWLRRQYASTDELRRAWSEGEAPAQGGDLLADGAVRLRLEVAGGAEADIEETRGPGGVAIRKVTVHKPSPTDWHVQHLWAPVAVQQGANYTLRIKLRANREVRLSVGCRMNHEPWSGLGLSEAVAVGARWEEFAFSFVASQDDPNARIGLGSLSQEGLVVWFTDPTLEMTGRQGLLVGQGLAEGAPWPHRRELGGRTGPVARDVVRFLRETEVRYWADMREFLRGELGVRMPVTGTAVGFTTPHIAAETADFVDSHAYWQHPHFPGRPWDSENWTVANVPMVGNPSGSTIAGLAGRRVFGLPYTVTEYNHPAPNQYEAEGFPLLAVYGSFQRWDGAFTFTYSHGTNWEEDRFGNFFDIAGHPSKMAEQAACSRLFRDGQVGPPPRTAVGRLSLSERLERIPRDFWGIGAARAVGDDLAWQKALLGVAVADDDPETPKGGEGRVQWDASGGRGVVRYEGTGCAGMIGFAAGETLEAGALAVTPGDTSLDGFSVVMLSSVDGQDLGAEGRCLITAVAAAANPGMTWNKDRTSVGRGWGSGPTLCEGVPLTVSVRGDGRRVRLFVLDPDGTRRREAPAAEATGQAMTFELGPSHRTLWYELVVGP